RVFMPFEPDLAGYDDARPDRFYDQLKERARSIPGVKSATLTSSVPFDAISIENTAVAPEGFQFPAGTESVRVRSARVDEDYFDTLAIGLITGRPFRPTDSRNGPRVAVV